MLVLLNASFLVQGPHSAAAGKELAEACEAKNREKALRILRSGNPELSQKSSKGWTPLQKAAFLGWRDGAGWWRPRLPISDVLSYVCMSSNPCLAL